MLSHCATPAHWDQHRRVARGRLQPAESRETSAKGSLTVTQGPFRALSGCPMPRRHDPHGNGSSNLPTTSALMRGPMACHQSAKAAHRLCCLVPGAAMQRTCSTELSPCSCSVGTSTPATDAATKNPGLPSVPCCPPALQRLARWKAQRRCSWPTSSAVPRSSAIRA